MNFKIIDDYLLLKNISLKKKPEIEKLFLLTILLGKKIYSIKDYKIVKECKMTYYMVKQLLPDIIGYLETLYGSKLDYFFEDENQIIEQWCKIIKIK
ncbi:hypothetical protein [[Mycoplasma] anseris]|uniref:Uncharacterized protein n=1 Tax=[Mycoplasma] anseris TaxID=92400 RepID=A0A2Z4NDE1_9BACT|nr:hypothetical protein [[Mycoplasma] anseris]AWX69415.1 hypothetical protein DP065_01440 [[Mycoplasma] anseris]